jgi:hypothetical protein
VIFSVFEILSLPDKALSSVRIALTSKEGF